MSGSEPHHDGSTRELRDLMRQVAFSVSVVTVAGHSPRAFTATSFTSVEIDPPLISVCVSQDGSAWPTLRDASHIAVNVLSEDQEDVARLFATPGIDRLAIHGDWRPGEQGCPLLGSVLAHLECKVAHYVEAGRHAIVLATPTSLAWREGRPLMRHGGTYTALAY
ncbi:MULTISPECIES: flavin reductase family protein [unclassified Actinoplanes]|uniref:flavin reductase family protein n=1 Tax=unclassified Actinoplanes TaxID=2626549 RepID=UPI001E38D258|nr:MULTISPECIES: flavin reductase family protein [unclassified Actinoplanes]